MHVAVAVLRVQEGLDYTGIIGDFGTDNGNRKNGIDNPHFVVSQQDSFESTMTPYSKQTFQWTKFFENFCLSLKNCAAITGSMDTRMSELTLDEIEGTKIRRAKANLAPTESSLSTVQEKRIKKSRLLLT